MDFMQFPGFGQQKAPKVETTVENLLKEETWARFQSLGEWVKKGIYYIKFKVFLDRFFGSF